MRYLLYSLTLISCLLPGLAKGEIGLQSEGIVPKHYAITASHTHKFVWLRIPKNGSRTLVQLLREHLRNEVEICPTGRFQSAYDRKQYEGYFTFTFVRNPWDRAVSSYFWLINEKEYPPLKECWGMSFDEFVEWLSEQDLSSLGEKHLMPQSKYIPPDLEIDFIGRLERYHEDLRIVMDRLGCVVKEIPHINKTDHTHYSHYYTPRTRELVRTIYAQDIAEFGYEYEDDNSLVLREASPS